MERIKFDFNAYKKNVRFSNVVVNHKRPDCHFKELKIDRKYISLEILICLSKHKFVFSD